MKHVREKENKARRFRFSITPFSFLIFVSKLSIDWIGCRRHSFLRVSGNETHTHTHKTSSLHYCYNENDFSNNTIKKPCVCYTSNESHSWRRRKNNNIKKKRKLLDLSGQQLYMPHHAAPYNIPTNERVIIIISAPCLFFLWYFSLTRGINRERKKPSGLNK